MTICDAYHRRTLFTYEDGPVAQRLEQGLIIQARVLARIFTALHAVADARRSSGPVFATRCRDLRIFAAKMSQTVENDRKA
jgi:hypothetical protein